MGMKTFHDYLKAYTQFTEKVVKPDYKKIRVAVVSSFNTKGFKEVLFVQCHDNQIDANIYLGEYAQYNQEILNPSSGLYQHDPDLTILFVDVHAFLGDYMFNAYDLSAEGRRKVIMSKFQELAQLIDILEKKTRGKIIVHNFELPSRSMMGILENKQEFGLRESVGELNARLEAHYRLNSRVYVYDYNARVSDLGQSNVLDPKMNYIGDIKIGLQSIANITQDYLAYIKPMVAMSKKCLVLDLDNTLWGGILGEDGIEGIHLGPTPQGRVFWEMQKYILSLFKRGVILAINSRNNREEAVRVFKDHPYMILKEEHFASVQINWDEKTLNMQRIAKDLNIGLESMVFVDDDKFMTEMVAREFPQMRVIRLPDDPALNLKVLKAMDDFSVLQITEEDKNKGRMYAQNLQRQQYETTVTNIDEYLKGLDMKVTIVKPNDFTIPRLSQLTQKTNQWNMTNRRYLEEDIKQMSEQKSYLVQGIQVEDKFGDNGIVGLVIVHKKSSEWHIENCLMSCRVIGRNLEHVLIGDVINLAKKEGARRVTAEFIASKKNDPAKDVYPQLGFQSQNGHYYYDTEKGFSLPDFMQVQR